MTLRVNSNFGIDCVCSNSSYDVLFQRVSETVNSVTYNIVPNQTYCESTGDVASGNIVFTCVSGELPISVNGTVIINGTPGGTFSDQNCPRTISINTLIPCGPSSSVSSAIVSGGNIVGGENSPIPEWSLYAS